jgi:hypothetical protein
MGGRRLNLHVVNLHLWEVGRRFMLEILKQLRGGGGVNQLYVSLNNFILIEHC